MVDCEVCGESRQPGRKKSCIIISVVAALILIRIIVRVRNKTAEADVVCDCNLAEVDCDNSSLDFNEKFICRCKKSEGYDCPKVWAAFEQAYVGRDKCDVPVEAYDALIAAAPFGHVKNKTLLWSKTEDMVNKFKENESLFPLADTLFGNVTKGNETWCGRKGSKKTFTTDCPGWNECNNNPVRSYWSRVSAAFAEYAQGNVTALLSGSYETPFDPESIFAKFEVPALKPGTRLNVVLVTQKISKSNCTSLGELRRQLDAEIKCWCKEVPESQMSDYSSITEKPCGS